MLIQVFQTTHWLCNEPHQIVTLLSSDQDWIRSVHMLNPLIPIWRLARQPIWLKTRLPDSNWPSNYHTFVVPESFWEIWGSYLNDKMKLISRWYQQRYTSELICIYMISNIKVNLKWMEKPVHSPSSPVPSWNVCKQWVLAKSGVWPIGLWHKWAVLRWDEI